MIEYPGCSYYPVAYADKDVVIRKAYETVHVYHRMNYKTPLNGNNKNGWLCCGTWKISADGKYHEQNGIGYLTGRMAETLEDISKIISIEKGENDC